MAESSQSLHVRPVRMATVWVPKIVTTDPPRLVPHTEWRLDLKIVSAILIRTAVVFQRGRDVAWGLPSDQARQEAGLCVSFTPADWQNSDRVTIGLGWRITLVEDVALKEDPRRSVDVLAPETATTGAVITVARIPRHDITLSVLPLDVLDVEARRESRWRVRPDLRDSLPTYLADMASGRQSGAGQLD
jgi:hypothetical protein